MTTIATAATLYWAPDRALWRLDVAGWTTAEYFETALDAMRCVKPSRLFRWEPEGPHDYVAVFR